MTLLTYNRRANLLHAFLSACDEQLVPIQGYIHRNIMIYDYQQLLIHIVEFQTTILKIYILFFEISLNSHFCISLFRNMWHVYSPQYQGHDDLSLSPFSFQISRIECFIVIAVISSQKIKPGITLISWKPQFHNINWKQPCNSCNKIIQIVVRFFVDHRIKQHTSLLVSETVQ